MYLSPKHSLPEPIRGSIRPPPPVGWLRRFSFAAGVASLTLGALALALRAMPLTGWARLVYATAIALNTGLLAVAILGPMTSARSHRRSRQDDPTRH